MEEAGSGQLMERERPVTREGRAEGGGVASRGAFDAVAHATPQVISASQSAFFVHWQICSCGPGTLLHPRSCVRDAVPSALRRL